MQHAMCVRHIVIYGLPPSTVFFPLYLTNDTIFEKKVTENKWVFRFSLQPLSDTSVILRRIDSGTALQAGRSRVRLLMV
jgi:hypothetical protein